MVTAKDIVNDILDGKPAADNPEAALQKIFSILAVLPSIRLGLIDTQTLPSPAMAPLWFPIPPLTAGIFTPAAGTARSGMAADAIILTRMPHGDGTAITKHGSSDILFICCAPGTMR